jgi:hypothetical protein
MGYCAGQGQAGSAQVSDEFADLIVEQSSPAKLRVGVKSLLARGASAAEIKAFIAAQGYADATGVDEAVAFRDGGGKGVNVVVDGQAVGLAPETTADAGEAFSDLIADTADAAETVSSGEAPPAMFAAMKGLAKGAAFPLDLAAQGMGQVLGAGAELFGADGAAASLRNPFTLSGALDNFYPTPEGQQGVDAVFQGLGGAGAGIGIGRGLAAGLESAPGIGSTAQRIGSTLAAQPGLQAASGGAASLAGYGVQQAGGGVPAQIAASLAAGVLPFGGAAALNTGARATLAPMTADYVQDGAARLLQGAAVDPAAAAARIRAQNPINVIPGVQQTTAEVAGDAGLAGLSRGLTNLSPQARAAMQLRDEQNMLARAAAIDGAAGPGDAYALRSTADAEAARLDAGVAGAVDRVGPLTPADVSGETVRGVLAARADEAKRAAGARYDNLPGGDEPLQVGAYVPNDMRSMGDADTGRAAFEAAGRQASGAAAGKERGLFSLIAKQGVNVNGTLAAELRAAGYGPRDLPGVFRTNGGVMDADSLIVQAREQGFIREAGDGLDDFSGADLSDMLLNDIRAMGRGGTGNRVVAAEEQSAADAAREAESNRMWWGEAFDERGLEPDKMTAEDWDAMYRDVEGLGPRPVTQDDVQFLVDGADAADGAALLSPFQASLVELQRQFFPAGLPANSNVGFLIRQLTSADVMTTRQVERVARDLRKMAGRLKGKDGESEGLAKAAANAVEGFLISAAGPERAAALAEARAAYAQYAATFREGEPGKALAETQFRRPVMDAARVPGAVVPRGVTGGTATRRLVTAAGPEAAEQAAREEVRRALESAGTDRAAIDRVAASYGPVLAETPTLAADVRAAQEMAALGERFAGSPLGQLRNGSESPQSAVRAAVVANDDGTAFRAMRAAVRGNVDAESGLRRALADYVVPDGISGGRMTASNDSVPSNLGTMKALDKVLRKTGGSGIFSREQRGVLIEVRRQLKQQQFASSAARASGSDTAMNAGIAGRIGRIALEGVSPGAGRTLKVIDTVIGFLGNASQIGEVAREAMLDPKLAADLLERATPQRMAQLQGRLTAITEGATAGALASAKEPGQ